jgi:hypothetical protein
MLTFFIFVLAVISFFIAVSCIERGNEILIAFCFSGALLCLILVGMRCGAVSPTARDMWAYDKRCLAIKNTLTDICDNISEYEIKEDYSENRWNYGNVIITHRPTGTVHKMWISDADGNSYIHWYRNGQLVLRNGYKGKNVDFKEEYYPLVNNWYTTEAINDYIFQLIENIIKAKRANDILNNEYCNTDLLIGNSPSTKTLEVTAPVDTTITAEVSQNNNIIHQEQI